jgi:hypothetical protein
MKKFFFLLALFLMMYTSSFAYYLWVRAYLYPYEDNEQEINARIYIDGNYTGFLTPHKFEPYVGGVYTVQHDDYSQWVPEYAVVQVINASGTVIFGTYPDETNPVELSYFNATTSNDNFAYLQWATQSETGVQGFYILRNTQENLSSAVVVSNQIPATNTSDQQTYIFKDTELYDNGVYYYWLQLADIDGSNSYTGPVLYYYSTTSDPTPEIPLISELKSVYPNPFNPLVFIPYSIANRTDVNFRIFNMRGQIVKQISEGSKMPGNYRISWEGKDDSGSVLPNGIYYVIMSAGNSEFVKKAVLLK